jgi:orotidine-5'-phosphate decarboxylase
MKERIVLVLDVSSRAEALELVGSLNGLTGMFKVGLQLFTAEGPALVREIIERGGKVFLDLKFHDIPNTVRNAAVEAAKLGVSMMTIHTAGGRKMMEHVVKDVTAQFGRNKPIIVGVTVLTSLDDAGLEEIGIHTPMEEQVLRMARLAESCGLDGVVCSPHEIESIRRWVGPQFKIVTPGIRLPGQASNDQQRTAAPGAAIAAGADYIVVGRAITSSADPRHALEQVIHSMG